MKRNLIILLIAALGAVIVSGCTTVPKEMVRLSDQIGKDLTAIHESYDHLIHEYYNSMRAQRLAYLDDVWYPRFIQNWMEDGELRAIAAGEKIWSADQDRLIPVTTADPVETEHTLRDWLDYALYAYEEKRETLTASLDQDEMALRRDVKSAFQQLIRANSAVTAHLNSIREVKEVQDEALSALNIKKLRDNINDKLAKASEEAKKGLDKIKQLDAASERTTGADESEAR